VVRPAKKGYSRRGEDWLQLCSRAVATVFGVEAGSRQRAPILLVQVLGGGHLYFIQQCTG
jgi:hypothetical protein